MYRRQPMRRVLVLMLGSGALALLSPAFASQAMAATTVPVSMTFTEPIVHDAQSGCPVLGLPNGGFCGSGNFLPYGHATEMIAFAPEGEPNVRTVTVAGGSIVLDETFSNPQCPGSCQPNPAAPGSGTLTDVVVGGTGIFERATGTLTGTVKFAGQQSQIKLSGAITLAT